MFNGRSVGKAEAFRSEGVSVWSAGCMETYRCCWFCLGHRGALRGFLPRAEKVVILSDVYEGNSVVVVDLD